MSAQENTEIEFIATLGHELRTPAGATLGHVANLLDGIHGDVSADQRTKLLRIRRLMEHQLSIVNRSLDAVAAKKRMEVSVADVRLAEVIAELKWMLLSEAHAKRMKFDAGTRRCEFCQAVVRADRGALLQILTNLVGNAIKFTPPEGRVTITCAVNERLGMSEVRVTDTGPGIPPDQISKVFKPFVRLAGGTAGAEQGVGLGLAISRYLARAMGGDLEAASTVGVGSTFTLTLPLS
jgi:signal transduction histidine kinase